MVDTNDQLQSVVRAENIFVIFIRIPSEEAWRFPG